MARFFLTLYGTHLSVSVFFVLSVFTFSESSRSQSRSASHFPSQSASFSNQFSSSTSPSPFAASANAADELALDFDTELSADDASGTQPSSSSGFPFSSAFSGGGSSSSLPTFMSTDSRNSKADYSDPKHSENAPHSSINAQQCLQNSKGNATVLGMPSKRASFDRANISGARAPSGTTNTRAQTASGARVQPAVGARAQSQASDASSLLSLSAEDFDFDFEVPNASGPSIASGGMGTLTSTSTPTSTAPTVNRR